MLEVFWRVSSRSLILDLCLHLLVFLCLLVYMQKAAVPAVFIVGGCLLILLSIMLSVHTHRKNIGLTFSLIFDNENARFVYFTRDDQMQGFVISHIKLLWQCAYCSLIQIETVSAHSKTKSWRQWIYSTELSAAAYACILRELQ